ncbi:MAG: PH domain-containing protein [Euryarchaeota archaeon]
MSRAREWPVYPRSDPRTSGYVFVGILNLPFLVAAVPLLLMGVLRLSSSAHPPYWMIPIATLFAAVLGGVIVLVPYAAMAGSVVVRADGLEVREPFRTEFVKAEEVTSVTVLDGKVVLELVDGREVKLRVLDPEGFAKTIQEVWGFRIER